MTQRIDYCISCAARSCAARAIGAKPVGRAKTGRAAARSGGRGLEVHEHWDYDDATGVQALRRLLALCRGCHASTHYGLAEVQGRDGEAFAIGIILVVIGVILAILAAPAPAIAGRRHFF
jgi:hypothetical protein